MSNKQCKFAPAEIVTLKIRYKYMNNQETYKRVKINWWIIILFVGIYIHMIYQWGNNPMDKEGLVFLAIIFIGVLVFLGRFKVIIDSDYAVFRLMGSGKNTD